MKPSLDAPKEKLGRAREHLKTFYDEMLAYMKTDPFGTTHEVDSETGDDVFRLDIRELPPVRLSVIAGDVAHNFRSSLDYLVWQLALTTTDKPNDRSAFPIYGGDADTDVKVEQARKQFNTARRSQIGDLPPAAQDIIESVQPYHRGHEIGADLALLQEVNNTDKHRVPVGVLARQTGLSMPLHLVDYLDAVTGIRNHGDEVMRIRRVPERPDLDEYDKKAIRVTFDLGINTPKALGRPGGVITLFNSIHMMIDEKLLPQFRRFFR